MLKRLLTAFALAVAIFAGGTLGPVEAQAGKPSAATMTFAHDAGQYYWTRKGYESCPGKPTIYYKYRYRPNADWLMWAYIWGDPRCQVTVNTAINWRALARQYNVYPATIVCAVMVHEHGHLAGKQHTRRGIMRGDDVIAIPPVCRY